MGSSRIARAKVEPFDLPLPTPFATARARRTTAHNLLLMLELEDGTCGVGEVAPAPHVTGEDQSASRRVLEGFAADLVGADVSRYRAISAGFQGAHPQAHSARAGLEAALLDAFCRHVGVPLFRFLGGASREVRTDVTIPIVAPHEAADAARRWASEGFTDLKVKIGLGHQDCDRILAVARAAPAASIRLDGNQGFTAEDAVALLERVLDAGVKVTLFEQPVHRADLAGLRFVRERAPVPVAADESVITPEDAYRVAEAGAADVVNIKLMKAGLLGALDVAGVCRAAGMRLMLGCMLESRLGISVAAHFAAGLGDFEFVDLDGHLLTADTSVTGGFEQTGSRLAPLDDQPGHGAQVLSRG